MSNETRKARKLTEAGMEQIPKKRKRRFGDRSDGRRVRTIPPMSQVAPFIMPNRNGASNYFDSSIEVTEIERYIRKKRREGLKGFGVMHVLLAAYVRVVSQRPAINRFLAGQHIFQRDDMIEIIMTIKKEMSMEAPDTEIKAYLTPADTADVVYEKLNKVITEQKEAMGLDSSFDKTASFLNHIPGVILKFTLWFLKLLDYFGLLPASLIKLSPFHGSIVVTSMGSLGIPPINHHLYDFGTVPVFLAFGAKRKAYELDANGQVQERKYIDYRVTTDERICDGFYYASAFKLMNSYLKNPFILDTPVEAVVRDIP